VSAQEQQNSTYWRRLKKGLRSNELKFLQWMCLQKRTAWGQMKIYSVWITGDKSNPKNL
jgi:hypothetical protein